MFNRMLHLLSSHVARPLLLGALAFALLGAVAVTKQSSAEASLSQDEIDALVAPIALYSDGLLTSVDRIDLSARGRRGRALRQAEPRTSRRGARRGAREKHWDPSVQSLAAYPRVLIMMSEKLEWTERLGNAFLEEQGRVMDTVQALRKRQAAGNLKSTNEQTVVREKETIIIEPAQRDVVYVYDYDPAWAYGAYWYAAAAHYYDRYSAVIRTASAFRIRLTASPATTRAGRAPTGAIAISRSMAAGNRFWSDAGRSHAHSAWQPDASHRRGVDCPTSAMREQFGPGNGALRAGEGRPGSAAPGPGSGMAPGVAGHAPPGAGGWPSAAAGGPPILELVAARFRCRRPAQARSRCAADGWPASPSTGPALVVSVTTGFSMPRRRLHVRCHEDGLHLRRPSPKILAMNQVNEEAE